MKARALALRSFYAFVTRLSGAGMNLVLSVLVSRWVGADGAGKFFVALTATTLLAVLARGGLDRVAIRETARYLANNKSSKANGLQCYLFSFSILVGIALTTFSWAVVQIINYCWPGISSTAYSAVSPMILGIAGLAALTITAFCLQGAGRAAESLGMLNLYVPMLAIVAVFLVGAEDSVTSISMAYVVSIYTVLFYSIWRWRSFSRKWGIERIEKEGRRDIKRSARPLLALVICQQLTQWACLLVVGLFVVSDDVGRFAVAQRTSMLISFSLLAVNSVVGPMFAKLHDADNKEALQKIVTQSTRIVLLVATPLTLVVMVFSDSIMRLYGEEFVAAGTMLVILSIGQFVNVATGSCGNLLVMTGHESTLLRIVSVTALFTVLGGAAAAALYGVHGAAAVTATGISMQNILCVRAVKKHLKISFVPGI